MTRLTICLWMFVFGSAGSFASPPVESRAVSREEFAEIATQGQALLAGCQAPDCLVVGIGRSPTPITTYLQLVDPRIAINLPLSGFRYAPPQFASNRTIAGLNFYEPLTAAQQKNLFDHFERQIPLDRPFKKIIAIDFTAKGTSLVSAGFYLDVFFRERGRAVKIDLVAFVNAESPLTTNFTQVEPLVTTNGMSLRKVFLTSGKLELRMNCQRYDAVAEFQAWDVNSEKAAELNPDFPEFRRQVANRLRPTCESAL